MAKAQVASVAHMTPRLKSYVKTLFWVFQNKTEPFLTNNTRNNTFFKEVYTHMFFFLFFSFLFFFENFVLSVLRVLNFFICIFVYLKSEFTCGVTYVRCRSKLISEKCFWKSRIFSLPSNASFEMYEVQDGIFFCSSFKIWYDIILNRVSK